MCEASAVLLLVAVWGCGGSGSSGKNDIDTGLAEDKALQDVSPAESQTACENLRSAIEARLPVTSTVRHICELFGAISTTNAADCETMADSCVSQSENGTNGLVPREELDFSAGLECDGDTSAFAGCSVTVGEYEDCLNAQFSEVEAVFANFSCSKAGTLTQAEAQNLTAGLASGQTPASCDHLAAECPAASPFGDAEEAP
jgi:hypothetical protein